MIISLGDNRPQPARSLFSAAVLIVVLCGCAATPYRYGGDFHTERDAALKPGESQIERGRRAPVIDTVGWVVGAPAKIIMLNHRVANHNVSTQTEDSVREYLTDNHLDKVKVRINEYDPGGEWRRLTQNESVAWPIRYTVGTLSVAGYTLLPGRVFGSDSYNPFTNTISIYSDVPSLAMYEAGYSKDYAQRKYKGLYAVGYVVPGIGLWQDIQASGDAMKYIQENGTEDDVKAAYRSVSPAFAIRAVAPLSGVADGPAVLTAAVAGHVSGQIKAARVKDPEPREKQPSVLRREVPLSKPTDAESPESYSVDPGLL